MRHTEHTTERLPFLEKILAIEDPGISISIVCESRPAPGFRATSMSKRKNCGQTAALSVCATRHPEKSITSQLPQWSRGWKVRGRQGYRPVLPVPSPNKRQAIPGMTTLLSAPTCATLIHPNASGLELYANMLFENFPKYHLRYYTHQASP
jgi:hypothetical protein